MIARGAERVNISMKSRYAVRALTELSRRDETEPGRPVPLGDIASARAMPLQFLEQVFAALRRAGIVRSRRWRTCSERRRSATFWRARTPCAAARRCTTSEEKA